MASEHSGNEVIEIGCPGADMASGDMGEDLPLGVVSEATDLTEVATTAVQGASLVFAQFLQVFH